MKHVKIIAVFTILFTAATVSIWYRNRTVVLRRELQQHPVTKLVTSSQTSQRNPPAAPHLLYGKASLSKDEKRILYQPFKGFMKRPYRGQDYKVGMICLKHRLTRDEVTKLIGETPHKSELPELLIYNTCIASAITFRFDKRENLLDVRTTGSQYQLPPLESVTPDTPIDLPPLPHNWDYAYFGEGCH